MLVIDSLQNVKTLVEQFSKVKVLVIGDVMLDRYWWGNVSRISPEAPVPVVNLQKRSLAAGGAANVAANIAGLGAKPYLIGAVGRDEEGSSLPSILAQTGVAGDYLVALVDRPTTTKTRIVAHNQHIVRIDQEEKANLDEAQEALVWEQVERILPEVDLIIVSDYAKGLLTDGILERLISKCRQYGRKVLVDPKGKDYRKYHGATLLTPNKREAAEACKLEEDGQDLVETAGKMLMSDLGLEALLITQGEDGMTLFEGEQEPVHFLSASRDVYDVTGAGDTVISTLGVVLAAGGDLRTAAQIANIAAGIVIEHFGTTSIKFNELTRELGAGTES